MLLDPNQEFSLPGVDTTESSERGKVIKVFCVVNPTLKMDFHSSCNSNFLRTYQPNKIKLTA